MQKDSQAFKDMVLDLATGQWDLAAYPVDESRFVQNEYEEGGVCAALYDEMRAAYDRACARLGRPGADDRDLDIIVSCLRRIERYMCGKMYDYGRFFAAAPAGDREAV